MSDIFISYAREDAKRAERLAQALQAQGWSVFWDRTIPPGQTWREYIGAKLNEARCLIVAWSEASVASEWVMEEADDGKQRGILVPVFFDEVSLPLGFRHVQAANLIGWDGDADAADFQQFIAAINGCIDQSAEPAPKEPTTSGRKPVDPARSTQTDSQPDNQHSAVVHDNSKQTPGRRRRRALLVSIIILCLAGVGLTGLIIKKKTKKPGRVVPTEQPTKPNIDKRLQLR